MALRRIASFIWAGLGIASVALLAFQGEIPAALTLAVIFAYPFALLFYLREKFGRPAKEYLVEPKSDALTKKIGHSIKFTWFYLVTIFVISGYFVSAKLSLFFLAIGIAPFVLPGMVRRSEERAAAEAAAEAAAKGDFKPAYRMKEVGGRNLLFLDPNSQRFAIRRGVKMRYYSYSDLIAVEVEKDGSIIQKTTKESSLMGGVAGGLIAGPVGMAVGLFSGSGSTTTSREFVHELALKLHINDVADPVYRLKVLTSRRGCSAKQAQPAAKKLDEWYARMRGVLGTRQSTNSALN